jgi:hypothetical protein
MKQKILLFLAATAFVSFTHAQKKVTAYAITGLQKGQSNWTEVKLVDMVTGDEVRSVYQSSMQPEILNARTGKPVVKKDNLQAKMDQATALPLKKQASDFTKTTVRDANGQTRVIMVRGVSGKVSSDMPFATRSAACAYDKKHERLYYTPMNVNQLRYIDLKTNKIFYFEEEAFGALKSRGDVPNQITRMVIASDGNGYALTNDGNHLIQFTTGKKPVITDLGAVTDDAANAAASVHRPGHFGGDMIADANKNLYLIGADHAVYKISLESRVATYLGRIKGLPAGYSTNGAVVEGGSSVIVTSSTSTIGYYRFDLNTLQSEKISTGGSVYNASDLANGTLAFEKEKKKKEEKEVLQPIKPDVVEVVADTKDPAATRNVVGKEEISRNNISIYPNPVTTGVVRLSFADQPAGKYQIQFMDVSGKVISSREVTVSNKMQVEEFRLPESVAKGNYLMKIVSEANKLSSVNKLVVQ